MATTIAVIGALAAFAFANPVPGEAAGGFRLLKLNGAFVKWGAPAFGTGATVSYALLDGGRDDPHAINCKAKTGLAGPPARSCTSSSTRWRT